MIKLERPNCPEELTPLLQLELTDRFKSNGARVWAKDFIKSSLLAMSSGKCAFCEIALIEEGKYLQVEHFHHKDKYPDEVVAWDNLLPACGRCNSNKGTHDTKNEPIIDPTVNDPKQHIYLKGYRIYPRTPLGETSIGVLYLNDLEGLVIPRFNIGVQAIQSLEDILDRAKEYRDGNKSTQKKNKVINSTKQLLKEAHPSSEYSATVASVILAEKSFYELKELLQSLQLWDDELNNLEKTVEEIRLDIASSISSV